MFDRRSSIILIALGSVIVIMGITLYLLEFAGATGMIALGAVVEAVGAFFFIKSNKKS